MVTTIPKDVSESQWRAIRHRDSHLLILIPPGESKIQTLVHRVNYLSQNLKENQCITVIVSNDKTAAEMHKFFEGQVYVERCSFMVGTFHQLCLQFLRDYVEHTYLPMEFKVGTPFEVEGFIKREWTYLKDKEIRAALKRISIWKSSCCQGEVPNEINQYNNVLKRRNLIDSDDVFLEFWRLLKNNEDILQEVQNYFYHIFVDEYQNMNQLQQALLQMLAESSTNITAFANPEYIAGKLHMTRVQFSKNFAKNFPGARVQEIVADECSTSHLPHIVRSNLK